MVFVCLFVCFLPRAQWGPGMESLKVALVVRNGVHRFPGNLWGRMANEVMGMEGDFLSPGNETGAKL